MTARRLRYAHLPRAGGLMLLVSIAAVGQPACSRERAGESGGALPARAPESDTATSQRAPDVGLLAEAVTGTAPAGWVLDGALEQYTPQNLYEKINGLAELFLSYDVVALTFASFAKPPDAEVVFDVSVYDMGTPTNAFGIFSVERSPDEPPVDVGRSGCRSDANFFIWQGRYYVKIIASDAGDELTKVGTALAAELTRSLPDSGEQVWGLRAMPRADRVPRSLRYFKVDAMGLDFMRDTYTARYRKGGVVVEAFLSRRDSPATAEATVAQYVKHAEKYGKGVERLTVDGVDLVRCDMNGTFDVVLRKGPLVAGVSAVEDPDIATQAATDLWRELGEF